MLTHSLRPKRTVVHGVYQHQALHTWILCTTGKQQQKTQGAQPPESAMVWRRRSDAATCVEKGTRANG